jgi:hypothetical protein
VGVFLMYVGFEGQMGVVWGCYVSILGVRERGWSVLGKLFMVEFCWL